MIATTDDFLYEPPTTAPVHSRLTRRNRGGRYSKALGNSISSSSSGSESDSSSEPSDPISEGLSSSIEDAWFRRARTFSMLDAPGNANVNARDSVLRRSSDSIISLPHATASMPASKDRDSHGHGMTSFDDRGTRNEGDSNGGHDYDVPAMRLGPEVTNDLRNIQLTFSRQPTQNQSANPLRHLIRSKHNFRALVTYGGYLIPVNILLNVILLGRGWLQYDNITDPDGERMTVSNPLGYLITSIISLVLIVASGVCFVLRCLEYNVITTTVSLIIANFANAVLILASAIMYLKNERPKHPDATLTGEYYCSYAGVAVALLNALLLLLDMLVTPGFRYRGSGMSRPQRMLQFNIIVIVVWIGIGGYVWSKIEGWDTVTSVMFCMVTVTTIGFGNKSPSPGYSRVLQLFYGPLGILMFGLMLLNTRNVIIQLTRKKIRSAKRDFEIRRKKLEQDVKVSQVKRRLAARPVHRTWKTAITDLLGRIFLSRGRRVRIGIPRWLRNKLDNDDHQTGQSDLEAGHRSVSDNDPESAGLEKSPSTRPEAPLSFEPVISDRTIPDASTAGQPSAAYSQRRDSQSQRSHISDNNADDSSPHPMLRTYTSASRLSQVREAIAQPNIWQRARRRVNRSRIHGRRKHSGSDADDDDDDDDNHISAHMRRHNTMYGDSNEDTDDEIDRYNSLHAGRTFQTDNRQPADAEEPGLRRARTIASVVGDKVNKARSKGKDISAGISDSAKQLLTAIAINLAFWTSTAAIFYAVERKYWNYFDALYFCYIAYTTIGYGDVVPHTTEGNIVFICFAFVAVALETFLVVSAVSYFTELISRAIKRTRVQKRIMKRHKSLVAYEIRRHIKHPNYNPFGRGEEDRMVKVGLSRLKRVAHDAANLFKRDKSDKGVFSRRHTVDQRQRDESLTEHFIRHTTGMGGFRTTDWQPPSPQMLPRSRSLRQQIT
ncbi:Potassium channel [Coemansia interrupta]|uniref:Potassium channel n=1 Tax=Coemansia interrupta TaxID=1126814 RepID=A0A9W8LHL6_9FUNG|nr:Potassium channel [Coemansia interrupta]